MPNYDVVCDNLDCPQFKIKETIQSSISELEQNKECSVCGVKRIVVPAVFSFNIKGEKWS